MKKLIFLLLLICFSTGIVVQAVSAGSTEVQIEIEASEPGKPDEITPIKTGDDRRTAGYFLAASVTALLGGICLWRKKKKSFLVFTVLFFAVFVSSPTHASEQTENVNVTVPSLVLVSFEQDGSTIVSDYTIRNESVVQIQMIDVLVTECNGWSLGFRRDIVPVNKKNWTFLFDGQEFYDGYNGQDYIIEPKAERTVEITVERGPWTKAVAPELAMTMEFVFVIGNTEFQLELDVNGHGQPISPRKLNNAVHIMLPQLEDDGYIFLGWEDSKGVLHTGEYVMPIGDTKLTAKWIEG